MTRQIALGAVIAFAVTVLALSVWEPKAPPAAPPPPPTAQAIDPGAFRQNIRPAALRAEALGRTIKKVPVDLAIQVDAGAPQP